MKKEITFTQEEMEHCFSAGYDFAQDISNNPDNSEYISEIIALKQANESKKSDTVSINNDVLLCVFKNYVL